MQIQNLTPHALAIILPQGSVTIPPSGASARCAMQSAKWQPTQDDAIAVLAALLCIRHVNAAGGWHDVTFLRAVKAPHSLHTLAVLWSRKLVERQVHDGKHRFWYRITDVGEKWLMDVTICSGERGQC